MANQININLSLTLDGKSIAQSFKRFFFTRHVLIIMLILGISLILFADTVTKPHTFTAGNAAVASEVNENFDTLYTLVNGNLNDANISGLSATKISGLTDEAVPTGLIVWWACPNGGGCGAGDIPTGFAVCDGSVINSPGSAWHGKNAPNLINKFTMGVTLGNNQNTGGSNSQNLSHAHTIPAHYHGMGSGADLNITNSGGHTHGPSDNGSFLTGTGGPVLAWYQNGPQPIPSQAATNSTTHSHPSSNFSGRIGQVSGGSNGNTTMNSGSSGSSSLDNRPAYVGLLPLLKL